jgi:hypothetical protein
MLTTAGNVPLSIGENDGNPEITNLGTLLVESVLEIFSGIFNKESDAK